MDHDRLTSFAEERMDYWASRKEEALRETTTTWRGIKPTGWIFDEMVDYVSPGTYRPVETPVPTMAEINAMITKFQAANAARFGPSTQEVAQMMERRFLEHDRMEAFKQKLREDMLGGFGLTEKQLRVAPRTYQERKQRRKKSEQ